MMKGELKFPMPSMPFKPYVRRFFRPFAAGMLFFIAGLAVIWLYMSDNDSKIKKANGWEEVKAYQYEKTPGLERAEKLKLTRNYDKKVNIPGTGKTLSIDEIWYNSQFIYIFYSVDMKSSRFSSVRVEDIPVVTFKVKNDQDEESAENIVFTQNWMTSEGVNYKNRYYGRLTASAFTQSGADLKLENVKQLELTDITVQIAGTGYQLPPVLLLGVDYNASQEITETIPIDQTFKALGHEIRLQRFELGTMVNRMYFRYTSTSEDDRFMGTTMMIKSDKEETRTPIQTNLLPDGSIMAEFPPFNRHPESVEIEVQSLKFFNNEGQIQFTIDASKFSKYVKHDEDSHREEIGSPIGRSLNTEIYLDQLYYDSRGIDFTVEYKPIRGMDKPYLRLFPEMPNSIMKAADAKERVLSEINTPMLVRVINEFGEEGGIGQRGAGSGARFDAFIDRELVEKSKELQVTIRNLVSELVTDWKTSISIPPGQ